MSWPESGDRPVHDGDRLLHLVRHMTAEQIKAEFIDPLSDVELMRLITEGLPSFPFRRLEARLRALTPVCAVCGGRHWPGDNPQCTTKEQPSDDQG